MTIKPRSVVALFLHAIGFLLVWEWLRPLELVADIYNLEVFIAFLFVAFLLGFLNVRWFIKGIFFSVFIIVAINIMFFNAQGMTVFTPVQVFVDMTVNAQYIVDAQWQMITDSFRTLLLFILLWLLIYILNFWLFARKSIFFFFLLTVIYLAVMDTFFPYNATMAMIRTFILGLIGAGMLNLLRLRERENIQLAAKDKIKWLFPFVIIIACSVTIGVAIPKANPIWPDPVPYIQTLADHHEQSDEAIGTGRVQKVGYDEDDSYLGGSFVQDNEPVFLAESEHRQYWRVETKDFYTGKGWELSAPDEIANIDSSSGSIPVESVRAEFQEEGTIAKIQFIGEKSHLVYPYGVDSISFGSIEEYYFNMRNEKVYFDSLFSTEYEIQYNRPVYEINALRATENYSALNEENPDFYKRYTQMPEDLPVRIQELAVRLTEDGMNIYDKTKKIESYLRGDRFTYNTTNVVVPGSNDDYVDQFLFETMIGYCDNFSSSMVVMLRSIGIPARWVKGYANGTEVGKEDNHTYYEITNGDAHSWVEVYFPNVGWVPFEPTKSFNNPAEFYFNLSNVEQSETNSNETTQTSPEVEEQKQDETNEPEKSNRNENRLSFANVWERIDYWFLIGVASFIIIGLVLFMLRRRWLPYWFIYKYRNKYDQESFMNAYLILLKRLNAAGITMEDGETLRSYAGRVDRFINNDDMSILTNQYERLLYNNNNNKTGNSSWEDIKPNWIMLLKQTRKRLK